MSSPSTMSALALVACATLAPAPSARPQAFQPPVCGDENDWPEVALPASHQAGLLLRLRATTASTHQGMSRLVSSWSSEAPAPAPALVQPFGERQPRFDVFSIRGRHALDFDGNDSLAADAAMPTGSYTKVVAFRLERPPELAGTEDLHLVSGQLGGHALYLSWDSTVAAYRLTFSNAYSPTGPAPAPTDPTFVVQEGVPTVVAVSYDAFASKARLYQVALLPPGPGGTPGGIGTWGLDGSLQVPGAPNADTHLRVGSALDAAAVGHFTGLVAEVLLYDGARTAVELVDLFGSYFVPAYSQYTPIPGGFAPRFVVRDLQMPRDGQLVPRDSMSSPGGGTGNVRVEGVLENADPSIDRVRLQVRRTGSGQPLYACETFVLGGGDLQPFSFELALPAGLHDYRLRLSALTAAGASHPFAQRRRVVCGDAYLLVGSSHAVAADYFDELPSSGPVPFLSNPAWIRSFGHGDPFFTVDATGASVPFDRHWDLGNVVASYAPSDPVASQWSHAGVGSLGAELADLLVQSEQVPIAVLQGGVGGSPLCAFRNPNTCLMRQPFRALDERAGAAGLAGLVRGVVLFQGAADGQFSGDSPFTGECEGVITGVGYPLVITGLENDAAAYIVQLQELVADWRDHFAFALPAPAELEVFAVQPRTDVFGINSDPIQNALRLMASSTFSVTSSTAVDGVYDAQHFEILGPGGAGIGYLQVAARLAPLVRREVYGAFVDDSQLAPAVQTATISPGGDVTLTFDRAVGHTGTLEGLAADFRFDEDDDRDNLASICDFVTFTCGMSAYVAPVHLVEVLSVAGNAVVLRCQTPTCTEPPTTVSYRGHVCNSPGEAWLTNAAGTVGALTFHKQAILPE